MTQEHINEIKAIVILAIGMILLASLISFVPQDLPWYTSNPNIPTKNLIRITGAYISGGLIFSLGYSSYFLVLFLFFWSWNKFTAREIEFTFSKFVGSLVLFFVISSLFALFVQPEASVRFERGGIIGFTISNFLLAYLGRLGAYVILFMLGALSLIISGEFLLTPFFVYSCERFQGLSENMREKIKENTIKLQTFKSKPILGSKKKQSRIVEEDEYEEEEEEDDVGECEDEEYEKTSRVNRVEKPKITIAPQSKSSKAKAGENQEAIVGEYRMPSLDLLADSPVVSTDKIQSDLVKGAKLLEAALASFGVTARVADIERGPAITRYELEPAAGVKVQKFTTLSDDIALIMKASAVRIVAPIPGKNRVGIEIPNDSSAAVFLKDVLTSDEFRNSKSKLTLSLGKDITGKSIVADLAEMPHLLIAGTTGSGKTVCVNGIIMSMLLNATPDEVKFVMIDPKMVELVQYNDIPHLLCPTVTDAKKASNILHWVVTEMENRYKKLAKAGVRNIKSYNDKDLHMPYIVVIIDELADLMQVSAKAVESSITRLAQLSRAVGIHLILATQRPSVDVITGVIKANFSARISFKVASKVDSRTVLDMNGAENLLGKGDMLFFKPGDAKPTRGQGNYVKDEEINNVIQFIKDQQAPDYDETIMQQQKTGTEGGSQEQDEYYDDAVRLIIETNQASVSILQRRMRLGYTRAARLIDMMEQNGIVGPYCGSKPRELLVDREQWLLENLQSESEEDDE